MVHFHPLQKEHTRHDHSLQGPSLYKEQPKSHRRPRFNREFLETLIFLAIIAAWIGYVYIIKDDLTVPYMLGSLFG